jgi:putative hydrolase of HD superfamily
MKIENGLENFIFQVYKLKTVNRQGWVKRGITNAESVADHSFGVSVLALLLAEKSGVDQNKIIKLGLVHDLAESVVGDIIPSDGVTCEEKHELENEAMKTMCADGGNTAEILALWHEYESGETNEAIFVKRLDKLEMMFQAFIYNKEQPTVDLEEFWDGMKDYDFGNLQIIYNALTQSRS